MLKKLYCITAKMGTVSPPGELHFTVMRPNEARSKEQITSLVEKSTAGLPEVYVSKYLKDKKTIAKMVAGRDSFVPLEEQGKFVAWAVRNVVEDDKDSEVEVIFWIAKEHQEEKKVRGVVHIFLQDAFEQIDTCNEIKVIFLGKEESEVDFCDGVMKDLQ